MPIVALRAIADPDMSCWYSCAFCCCLQTDFKGLEKLSRLYLHANQIKNLADVEKLEELRDLRSLTMHGNPVAEKPLYRNFVISTLPWLRTLDFSAVRQ